MMPRSWNFFQFFFPWYPSSAKPLSWVSHGKKKEGGQQESSSTTQLLSSIFTGLRLFHHVSNPRLARIFPRLRIRSPSRSDGGYGFPFYCDPSVSGFLAGVRVASRRRFIRLTWRLGSGGAHEGNRANALLRLLRFEIRAFFKSARFLVSIWFILISWEEWGDHCREWFLSSCFCGRTCTELFPLTPRRLLPQIFRTLVCTRCGFLLNVFHFHMSSFFQFSLVCSLASCVQESRISSSD